MILEHAWPGRRFKRPVKPGCVNGGAGRARSRAALGFVGVMKEHLTPVSTPEDSRGEMRGNPKCRDPTGKGIFHPVLPKCHLLQGSAPRILWYWNCNHSSPVESPRCCSDFVLSFHYVKATAVYELNYLSHHLHPYGCSQTSTCLTQESTKGNTQSKQK